MSDNVFGLGFGGGRFALLALHRGLDPRVQCRRKRMDHRVGPGDDAAWGASEPKAYSGGRY
jgi:hypothetical protein